MFYCESRMMDECICSELTMVTWASCSNAGQLNPGSTFSIGLFMNVKHFFRNPVRINKRQEFSCQINKSFLAHSTLQKLTHELILG